MCTLVQGFSITALMQQINIFLQFSRVSFSYKGSLYKVLMSDVRTTTTESIPTTIVHSRTRTLYKGTHVANQNYSCGFQNSYSRTKSDHDGGTWVHHLGTPRCTWVHLGAPGYTWVHLDTPGCTWVHLGASGYTWVHLGTPGYTWVPVLAPGCTWVHLGTPGYT